MEQHTQNTGNLAGAFKGQDAPEALSTGEFPVQPAGKLTPREKRWIMYDVGNSAFVLLSTAVVPIYANSLLEAAGQDNIVSTWGYAQTVASLVSMPDRPTAICTWADQLALPVIHDLEAMGLRVPGDISVFGFDGSDMAAAVNLSTMAQPAREIGRMAARHALNLVDGGTPDEATIVVPTTLEPGGTAGPARTPDNS